jgi:hypothetical protein
MQKKALNVTEGSASEIVEGRMSDGDTDRSNDHTPSIIKLISGSTDMLIVSNMQVSVTAVLICDLSSAIFRSDIVYCDDDYIDDDDGSYDDGDGYIDDGINDHDIGDDGFDI